MPSPEHEAIVQMLAARPQQQDATLEESRAGFEQLAALFPVPDDVKTERVEAGGVPAEWVSVPETREEHVLLYVHGGGYVVGSLTTHRELVSRLARAAGARVLNVDYRLAPEHPFPAAVEDATAAYRWLLAQGVESGHVAVGGDSAGGGLTLATLLALRDAGDPLPAAGICLSPWTDLEGTGASAEPGAVDDPLVALEGLREMARQYARPDDMRHPHASPLYGDYAGIPPLLLQVGTREILLDDATRLAERARAAGVDVELEPWEGLIHVWQLFGPQVPEGIDAVRNIGGFFRKHAG